MSAHDLITCALVAALIASLAWMVLDGFGIAAAIREPHKAGEIVKRNLWGADAS